MVCCVSQTSEVCKEACVKPPVSIVPCIKITNGFHTNSLLMILILSRLIQETRRAGGEVMSKLRADTASVLHVSVVNPIFINEQPHQSIYT